MCGARAWRPAELDRLRQARGGAPSPSHREGRHSGTSDRAKKTPFAESLRHLHPAPVSARFVNSASKGEFDCTSALTV